MNKQLLFVGGVSVVACTAFLYCIFTEDWWYASATMALYTIVVVIFLIIMKNAMRR